ncbi:MAG: hypothetical protein WC541_01160 [Dehalococcoidia bacterium]
MASNQFAAISKDLFNQIKFIESRVKDDSFKDAVKLLAAAEKTCEHLESVMTPDNQLQSHIVSNRRLEISWLHDNIQEGMQKRKKAGKKRTAK